MKNTFEECAKEFCQLHLQVRAMKASRNCEYQESVLGYIENLPG